MQRFTSSLLPLLIILLTIPATAQQVDFDKVVTPPEMGTRNFKEYLVQLAWMNSPENESLDLEKKLREFELKREKKDWTDDIRFTLNLNENHFNNDTIFLIPGQNTSSGSNNVFPKYNFSASVSLGTFINRKNNIGIAEQRVKIAEADINQKKLNVRQEVLRRYEEYEMQQEILKAATQAEEDANQAYILVTDLFKADRAKFEDYSAASTAYHAAVQKRITANAQMNIAELQVEEMIGIALEEAKRMRK